MSYIDVSDVLQVKSSGVVVPMLDGRGNPYPESLRTQQVGLGVARAIRERIDAAIAPRPSDGRLRPVKLSTVFLGGAGRAAVRNYLLAKLLPELYGDPIPAKVRAVRQIVSPKALGLLNSRMNEAFDVGTTLELPGVSLTRDDMFDLLLLLTDHLFADDRFHPAPQPKSVAASVQPAVPVAVAQMDHSPSAAAPASHFVAAIDWNRFGV